MDDITFTPGTVPAETWSDFLSPEQRLAAVAEIMAEAALLVLHERKVNPGDE